MSEAASMNAAECKAKGNAALGTKQFDEAIKWYTYAIEKDGTNHVFFSNRSAAHLSKGDAQNALIDAEACIKVKGDWAKGYNRKGAALQTLGKIEEAIAAFESGLKVDPNNAALKDGLKNARAKMQSKMPNPFGADMWTKLGNNPTTKEWLNDPQYVNSLNMIQSNPQLLQNPQMLQMMDQRILQTYMFLMGMGMPQNVPGAAPSRPTESVAQKEQREKEEAEAKKKAEEEEARKNETPEERKVRETKEKADAMKAEGNVFYKAKNFEKAIEKYEAACKIFPTEMTYMLNIAACYLEQKDFDKCIELSKEAIALGKENMAPFASIGKAMERIGMAYWKQKDYGNALEWMEKASFESSSSKRNDKILKLKRLKAKHDKAAYINPELGLAAKERGNVEFKKGTREGFVTAVDEYSEAIKRDPTNATYLSNRAAAYQKLMDFVRAKEDAAKAVELDPKFTKAYLRKAGCEFFLKEYHKAIDSYKKILSYDEGNKDAESGLQRTIRKVNETAGAEQDKERAAHAMADPEIQAILQDPLMNKILQDMSTDPVAAQQHMKDPRTMAKIEKLIAAGILKVGGAQGGQQQRRK
jgi:stress-induced-phosphoprotein 1